MAPLPTLPDVVIGPTGPAKARGRRGDTFVWHNQTGGTVAITIPAGLLTGVTSTATVVLGPGKKTVPPFELAGIPGEYDYTVVPVIQTVLALDGEPQQFELFRLAVRTGTIEIV